jgi:hypothetical protein
MNEACGALRKATACDPRAAGPWFTLGKLLYEAGHLETALDALEKGLEIEPANCEGWRDKASTLIGLERRSKARGALRKAIQCDPTEADPFFKLGKLLVDAGDLMSAMDTLREGLQIEPGNYRGHYYVGEVRHRIAHSLFNERKCRKAVQECDRSIQELQEASRLCSKHGHDDSLCGTYEDIIDSLASACPEANRECTTVDTTFAYQHSIAARKGCLTEIFIKRGDSLTIKCGDSCTASCGRYCEGVSPEGASSMARFSREDRELFVAPDLPCGSLIGRIGTNGNWFVIGRHIDTSFAESGRLHLCINCPHPSVCYSSGGFDYTIVHHTTTVVADAPQ